MPAHIGIATAAFAQKTQAEAAVNPAGVMQMNRQLAQMYSGLNIYQKHPYEPPQKTYDNVWKKGGSTLYHKRSHCNKKKAGAIFMVPSLINGYEIVDLCPPRSLADYLCALGYDVYLLDWGALDGEDTALSIEALINERLCEAGRVAAKHSKNTQVATPLAALGYCMGGTLLARAASKEPALFSRHIFLATPWDFHAGEKQLLQRVQYWAPSAMPLVAQRGKLPADWVQTLLASLDPLMGVEKFARFADMNPDSEEAQIFVAVEDWLNDGRDLPQHIARDCIDGWFLNNQAMQDLSALTAPSLVIASRKDRLVEFESARALYGALPRAALITPDCGHIGMIAGRHAVAQVWEPLARWLAEST